MRTISRTCTRLGAFALAVTILEPTRPCAGDEILLRASVVPREVPLGTPMLLRVRATLSNEAPSRMYKEICRPRVWQARLTSKTGSVETALLLRLRPMRGKERTYEGRTILMIDHNRKLLFPRPGSFSLTATFQGNVAVSNTVGLRVLAPDSEHPPLLNPDDYVFLLYGLCPDPGSKERASELAEEFPGTTVGRYAAVRLGLDEIRRALRARGGEAAMRCRATYGHLRQAVDLPMGDPIRQEALCCLVRAMLLAGDHGDAAEHIDLLANEPLGEYSSQVDSFKEMLSAVGQRKSPSGSGVDE